MKIIIDAYGGDNSPFEIIKGALAALKEKENFDLVFVGKESGIKSVLAGEEYDELRVSVVNAEDVISCNESPADAIRKKPDSSIVKSVKILKDDDNAGAFVSAGSTGAVLTAAVLLSPRIKGVNRPALAPLFPNMKGGETLFLDCGANVDCKPINLVQFALMGSVYMSEVKGVANPRVALLSNGTEDAKGNTLTKDAFALLKDCGGINFVGNMEARDILSGDYDVVVTDGFNGNIALKSMEGAIGCIFTELKKEIYSSFSSKIGGMLLKKSFKKIKDKLDYNKRGGALLLGMQKTVVKAHGASKAEAFKNAVLQAYECSSLDVSEKIGREIALSGGEPA